MGIISRRVLPACGSLCICCPELRARSRQPVKRYKKLLTDIFPKNQDEAPNDRKIGKLTEYASKNPLRIPKIASSLEQRGYKELRSERFGSVRVVVRAYSRLLVDCRDQMPLFATSALGMIRALLEQVRQDDLRILGCLTLVDFLQNQTDSTYMRNLDAFLPKLCGLARERDEESKYLPLCASALQALASMVSFMGKYSQISSEFKDIVEVVLYNYGTDISDMETDIPERSGDPSYNWLHGALTRLYTAKENSRIKDPSNLNRKESQLPNVWSQICVQNLARLSKEATTVRRILDPMFEYFDKYGKWSERLSVAVLHHMQYFMEKSGNEQLFLPMLVRHLDHKAVAEQPSTKANIVEIIGNLARHSKSKPTIADVGVMSDLLKHLRKSIQFTLETSNSRLLDEHIALQTALEDCLKELLKRVGEIGPVLDMMASNLEKLSVNPIIARATLDALIVLARCVGHVQDPSHAEQLFSEALLQQLLKAMMHPDIEVRVRAHDMFSLLLSQSPATSKSVDLGSIQTKPETSNVLSRTSSAINSLFEKLRKESQVVEREIQTESGFPIEKGETHYDKREGIELKKMGSGRGSEVGGGGYLSPSRLFSGLKPSLDTSGQFSLKRSISVSQRRWPAKVVMGYEMAAVKLSGHQAALLLSALWLQASLPDNEPSNFEAVANTYMLTLLYSRPKTSTHSTITRAFQLPFCLRRLAVDLDGNTPYLAGAIQLPPSRRRSLFMLATSMLVLAGQVYGIHQIIPPSKAPLTNVVKDPYMDLSEEDLRLKVIPSANLKNYGSVIDDSDALKSLSHILLTSDQTPEALAAQIVECSPTLAESEDSALEQMLQPFAVDEDEVLGPRYCLPRSNSHDSIAEPRDSLSFDETISGTGPSFEDDMTSDNSGAELPRLLARVSVSALPQPAIGVSQLLEVALQTAGQVACVSYSEAPLSYSDMASKCEAFGFGNRKKISCVLKLEAESSSMRLTLPEKSWPSQMPGRGDMKLEHPVKDSEEPSTPLLKHVLQEISFSPAWLTQTPPEPWQLFKLPPASPYDNFLKAACY